MAWEGYFCLGGTEIANNARAYAYARTANCPITWIKDQPCDGIRDMLGEYDEPAYDFNDIVNEGPWYDTGEFEIGPSQRFLGIYCISAENLIDSTLQAETTQRILSGGVIGRQRDASRDIRFRVLLTALDEIALDFGLDWLRSRLRERECATHSGSCGTTDLTWFTACQGPIPGEMAQDDYEREVDGQTRRLHGVKAISGPLIQRKLHAGNAWGYIVEFTLAAESPTPYSLPRSITPTSIGQGAVVDVPFNLVPYPSAELAAGEVVTAINLSQNPSVETNNTGWTVVADGAAILTANVVGSRSNELAAVGSWSQKALWTAPGAGGAVGAWFGTQQEVALIAGPANTRYSINVWGSFVVQAGVPVLGAFEVHALWRAGGVTLRDDFLGTIPGGSTAAGTVTERGMIAPVGATSVIVRVLKRVPSWSAGTIIRVYADALAVTVP